MSERRYRIRNKTTGLFYVDWEYDRGLTKAGKPRKTGAPVGRLACFRAVSPYTTLEWLNNTIENAIRFQIKGMFEDTEIVAYEYKPVKTTLKMDTVKNRHEAKVIMEKLKAK